MAIVAILSDIHSNYGALSAVLKRAANIGVDHYLILGDILGYYYDTKEVVHCVQNLPATVIAGNHERMFLKGLKSKSTRTAYKKSTGMV